jgi:hypothetical protein
VNSSAFCDLTKQKKGNNQASARFSARDGSGAYDAVDAGEEGVAGLGGRERRHPRAGDGRPGGDRRAAEPARVVLLPATPEQADQKWPRTRTPVGSDPRDLASDPGGNGAHLLSAGRDCAVVAGDETEAVCADPIVAGSRRWRGEISLARSVLPRVAESCHHHDRTTRPVLHNPVQPTRLDISCPGQC